MKVIPPSEISWTDKLKEWGAENKADLQDVFGILSLGLIITVVCAVLR